MMTMTDLKALRAIAEAATPGPWKPRRMPGASPYEDAQFIVGTDGGDQIADCYDNTRHTDAQSTSNATYIAAFNPAQAIALLDEVELLERLLGEACELADMAASALPSLHRSEFYRRDGARIAAIREELSK